MARRVSCPDVGCEWRPESPTIAALLEKEVDTDLLLQMISQIVERVTQFDVENLCAAGYSERTAERQNSSYGYCERLLELNDEWQPQSRHMSLEALRSLSDNQTARLYAMVN